MRHHHISGLEQIKDLERMYIEAIPEIRMRMLSRVMEIKTEISCGCMIEVYIPRRRK